MNGWPLPSRAPRTLPPSAACSRPRPRRERTRTRWRRPVRSAPMAVPDWLDPLYDAAQQRALDEWAIGELGMPGVELMERAGAGLAEVAQRLAPTGEIVVVCGKGNNGGDGLVCARLLRRLGGRARAAARLARPAARRRADELRAPRGHAARASSIPVRSTEPPRSSMRSSGPASPAARPRQPARSRRSTRPRGQRRCRRRMRRSEWRRRLERRGPRRGGSGRRDGHLQRRQAWALDSSRQRACRRG